ncbi:PaaI family thioesterase [Sporichthya brevicatena]|uniref:Acyl-coenzyme A thioesterase THEM4 n=2 Tax=Sporichthya brevicatena TaxID=171442 RepID=A0ABN1H4D6_9ACTN
MVQQLPPHAVAPGVVDGFADLVTSARDFVDALCASEAPEDLQRGVAQTLRSAAAELRSHTVDRDEAPAGRRPDLPGQGHPLLPAVVVTELCEGRVRAEVTFGAAHHGSGGAVHGGVIPLVYDDVLGRLAARSVVPVARTRSLEVSYEAVTPVARRLYIEGWIDELNGRKIFTSGCMSDGTRVLTTAKGFFVALRPGQP